MDVGILSDFFVQTLLGDASGPWPVDRRQQRGLVGHALSFTLLPVWLSRMTRVGVAVMPFDRAVSMSVLINRSTRSMSFAHFSSRAWSSSGKCNVPPGSPPRCRPTERRSHR